MRVEWTWTEAVGAWIHARRKTQRNCPSVQTSESSGKMGVNKVCREDPKTT
jgi:hypothetical protein